MGKVINFTGIDLYPDSYKSKKVKDGLVFEIRSVMIENVEQQQEQLVQIGGKLLLGDYIKVDLTFGHNTGIPTEDPSMWETIPLKVELKVRQIIPGNQDSDQIRLLVKPYRFRYKPTVRRSQC
jgi:hypothetical protein